MPSRWYHWSKETGKLEEGPAPASVQKFGEAPYVIGDTIDRFYHHGGCCYVDSRSRLRDIDNACGTITTDKKLPANANYRKENDRKRREDMSKCVRQAVQMIDSGNVPLTEEVRAKCERQNEILAAALPGLDPFNAVGRITNAKGKRYKRSRYFPESGGSAGTGNSGSKDTGK